MSNFKYIQLSSYFVSGTTETPLIDEMLFSEIYVERTEHYNFSDIFKQVSFMFLKKQALGFGRYNQYDIKNLKDQTTNWNVGSLHYIKPQRPRMTL